MSSQRHRPGAGAATARDCLPGAASPPAPRPVQVGAEQRRREQALTGQVLDALGGIESPRLRQLVTALATHLHAYVREVRLTEAEWDRAVSFLEEAGHITTARRQEFLLLADVLGLTMQVVTVNNPVPGDAGNAVTEATLIGPFFDRDSPLIPLGGDIACGATGTPLWAEGSIRSADGRPVSGALIEAWGCDADGLYDAQHEDGRVANRGHLFSGDDGTYRFWTVRPVPYPLPADGPAGRLMAATGRAPMRAAHLHLRVSAAGYRTLVTHMFDEHDSYTAHDGVFGVRASLLTTFEDCPAGLPGPDGRDPGGPWARVRFDMVLAPATAPVDPNAEVVLPGHDLASPAGGGEAGTPSAGQSFWQHATDGGNDTAQ